MNPELAKRAKNVNKRANDILHPDRRAKRDISDEVVGCLVVDTAVIVAELARLAQRR